MKLQCLTNIWPNHITLFIAVLPLKNKTGTLKHLWRPVSSFIKDLKLDWETLLDPANFEWITCGIKQSAYSWMLHLRLRGVLKEDKLISLLNLFLNLFNCSRTTSLLFTFLPPALLSCPSYPSHVYHYQSEILLF